MAHVASQRNIANLLKRRNASTIPRDQQKILDQPGSWAVELSHDSQLRVPRHVLETAKDVARASRKQATTEKKEPALPKARQPEKILTETKDVAQSVPDSSLGSPIGNATQERFVSWSPSPTRSLARVQPHSPLPSSIKDGDSDRERSPSISRRRDSNFSTPPPPASQVAFSDGQSSPPPTGHDRANFLHLRLTEIWGGNDWLPPSHRDRSRLALSDRILAALFRVTEIAQLKGVPLQSLWQKGGYLHPLSESCPDVEEQCLQIVRRMETKYALADRGTAHASSQVLADNDYGEENVALQITKPSIVSRYLTADFDFPSSGPEDALETQLPEAQIISQAPINRAAATPQLSNKSSSSAHIPATWNTPPCAQPSQRIIPATVRKHPSPPPEGHGEPGKKRRRMKPIQFSDPDDPEENVAVTESSRNLTGFSRMAPTKIYTQISSSNPISSSIVVPATIPQSPPIQKSPPQGRAQRASGPSGAQNQTAGQLNDKSDAMEITVPPTIPEVKPFELFTQTYPAYEKDYRGTIWSFVRACVCLDYLMKANSLRDYLWDDFIRAFSADYVEYVENTDDPLPALDWFNTLTGAPVFTQLLVKRDTIHDILNSYPDELRMAKSYTKEGGKSKCRDSRSHGSGHQSETSAGQSRATSAEQPRVSPQQVSSPPHDLIDSETVVETFPSTSIEAQDEQNNISPTSPKPQLLSSPTTPRKDQEPEKHDTPPTETTVPSTTRLEYPTQVNFPHQLLDTPHPPIPSSARSTATRSSTDTRRGSSYLQRLASSAKDPDAKRRERLRRHFLKKKSGSTPSSRKAIGTE
ncbi:unnamed protein product [Clonostachys rosea]|uniref:Uncharacterized protein n=1 Tax=Bionectria ochroleuca TaxID=29856 RepID=A0ABY6TZ08_BIOOC|nr:unnamed protein product [Clonostachys rosea]